MHVLRVAKSALMGCQGMFSGFARQLYRVASSKLFKALIVNRAGLPTQSNSGTDSLGSCYP